MISTEMLVKSDKKECIYLPYTAAINVCKVFKEKSIEYELQRASTAIPYIKTFELTDDIIDEADDNLEILKSYGCNDVIRIHSANITKVISDYTSESILKMLKQFYGDTMDSDYYEERRRIMDIARQTLKDDEEYEKEQKRKEEKKKRKKKTTINTTKKKRS